jgi:asparagine synthase (glutamine-hydrolysing)
MLAINNFNDTNVIIREEYGWRLYQNNNIKLWFCGYLYTTNIQDFFTKIVYIFNKNSKKNLLLDWICGLDGNFSFVIKSDSLVVASVDRIGSIPLFIAMNDSDILISNYAPSLKSQCNLDITDIDKQAELEISMSGYTIGNKTLYNRISRLDSGEYLILNQNSYSREYYHTYSPWNTIEKGENQFQDEFLDICLKEFNKLKNSIGNRQIVVPLSAGNDSRFIASGLKKVGVKNVVCFSYGRKGNFETPVSKTIADKLGYKWIYIQDCLKDKRAFFRSENYRKFVSAFESFSCTPNVQEVYEVFMLKKTNLINDNAIFINGSCGDFISGGHIRSTSDTAFTPKNISEIDWSKFLDKHYSLWGDLRGSDNDARIISELKKTLLLRIKEIKDLEKYHYAVMESTEFAGRQSKMVMGQQRIYEYFGYEWRAPLWSNEIIDFWERVPYKYKVDQYLYLETLHKNNWGHVWQDIKVNDKVICPYVLRWARILLKILFIPIGKKKWHRFEKNVLEYFMHPTYSLTVAPYYQVLFDKRGHRGTYSWLSHQMIQSKNK